MVAPHTSDSEAPGLSISEDEDQNADPMDHDDPDVPGPGPATLQIRMQNLPREDSLEKENQNLPRPGPATLELRKKNLQMAAAQFEDEEMEEDSEEEAQGAEDDVQEVACCSCELHARYNVPNKLCAEESKCKNEARISPNSEFMGLIKSSSNGKEYCMDCFSVNQKIQNKLYMKKTNQHEKFEEVLKCTECQSLWHRCCSLDFGTPNSCQDDGGQAECDSGGATRKSMERRFAIRLGPSQSSKSRMKWTKCSSCCLSKNISPPSLSTTWIL
ncbi:hypothetical protein B9Z55_022880 [Caenorhabditis nigoni]|uniref:Uncharacterized protein n=1 Tax=Caenorhabditis nigoni TaxID=1611254 RepID=A0A2G5SMP7_9PELO|nr:hypothetical protein B9Z55_022880 [Caenorhabditis nigoni]